MTASASARTRPTWPASTLSSSNGANASSTSRVASPNPPSIAASRRTRVAIALPAPAKRDRVSPSLTTREVSCSTAMKTPGPSTLPIR